MAEFFQTGLGIAVLIALQSLAIVAFVMLSLLFLVYGDRKIWAAVQMRKGPNVVGPFGLLQSVADALKYVVKEIVIPAGADRPVFFLAPMLSFVLAILAWAVVPFDQGWVLADINVAILFVFAASSLEVYGVIMGGWASNSKYPFLGSLRSAAQMISYEVSLGLIIIGIIISTGSMSFGSIVAAQDGDLGLLNWYWLPHFPMVFLFFISALAETNRPPFDLPEAESELVAGFMVEYSSTPYLLFMAGEYIAIFLMCALISLLFFGGWLSPIPGLADGWWWMVAKMWVFFFFFAMVKAIVPRYRYDQLMRIGWKVFLPLSLGWVVLVLVPCEITKFSAISGPAGRWAADRWAFRFLFFRQLAELGSRIARPEAAVMLGRQKSVLKARNRGYYKKALKDYGHKVAVEDLFNDSGFAEPMLSKLGYGDVLTMDFSDYEARRSCMTSISRCLRTCTTFLISCWTAARWSMCSTWQLRCATCFICCAPAARLFRPRPSTAGRVMGFTSSSPIWSGRSGNIWRIVRWFAASPCRTIPKNARSICPTTRAVLGGGNMTTSCRRAACFCIMRSVNCRTAIWAGRLCRPTTRPSGKRALTRRAKHEHRLWPRHQILPADGFLQRLRPWHEVFLRPQGDAELPA